MKNANNVRLSFSEDSWWSMDYKWATFDFVLLLKVLMITNNFTQYLELGNW